MNLKYLLINSLIILFSINSYSQVFIVLDSIPQSTPVDSKIYIAGNFNGWNPENPDYQLTKNQYGKYTLKFNTSLKNIEYKFTLGSWELVECSKAGVDIQNRELVVNQNDTVHIKIQAWKSGIKEHTASKSVTIINNDFFIPQLNRTRRIWIYLPPDYSTSNKRYPVFYAHDGQNLFDAATSFSGEWGIDECLDSLYSKGYKTSIVVGIDNGGIYRIEELTPWPNPKYGGGKAELYADFIVKTLKPYIDSNYRTLPDQKHTGVFGSSLGGLVSFYIGLKYPQIFSKLGVFSPSFWFSEESYKIAENFKKKKPVKMYIIGGAKEADNYEAEIMKMKQILISGNFKPSELKVEIIPDGRHNEWFWRREFPKVYLWLTGNSK